jgi:RimJ/RimL family protein N-acetyltransferase
MLAINFSNGCYFSVRLRAYRSDDAPRLADIANDPAVPRWMTARFPHPYSLAAAQEWVGRAGAESPIDNFAIEVDGELAGGIGITPQGGEIAGVAEFGYWLGRAYWGRGIATQAAAVVVTYAFAERQLRRLEAHVFAPNLASIRVLEKNGFRREAILRERYVERDGTIVDGLVYARLRSGS